MSSLRNDGGLNGELRHAIERTLGERTLHTKDLGGNADTTTCGKAVAEMVE